MSTPHTRTRRLALGTATALLTLGLAAGPALADATGASEDGKPAHDDKKKHLVISPGSGGANTEVKVKASCEPAGGVVSEALEKPIKLKEKGDGQWLGTGTIKSHGLKPGQTYPFRVSCTDGSHQDGQFTYTSTPSGGAAAGFGGSQGGSVATAAAIGGGIAVAGAAGYVFTTRRRAAGQQYY